MRTVYSIKTYTLKYPRRPTTQAALKGTRLLSLGLKPQGFTARFDKDIIEESWVYQEIIEKGKVEALQEVLLDVINDRFPDITEHAKKPIEEIEDPKVLRRLTVRMNTIQTPEEALQILLDLNKDSKKN